MDAQDCRAAPAIRGLHRDTAVEPPGSEQRGVQHVSAVRGREHDHTLTRVEAIHLGEDLIQRLFLLVIATEPDDCGSAASNRVQLIDEDDRWRGSFRFGEEVAHPGGPNTDDRLDELGCGDAEERHFGFARHRSGQQGFAGPRRTDQQHTFGHRSTEALVLLRLAKEIDNLLEVGFHLVYSGHIVERDRRTLRVVQARPALAEAAEDATRARGGGATGEIEESQDQQDRRPKAEQQGHPQRRRRVWVLGVHHHVVLLEQGLEVVGGERGSLSLELRRLGPARLIRHRSFRHTVDGLRGAGDAHDIVGVDLREKGVVRDGHGRRLTG